MRAVVDTNVVAYLLLATEGFVEESRSFNVVAYLLLATEGFVEESRSFMGMFDEGMAPAVWEAELANVVWMAVRRGVMPLEEGGKRLTAAARLRIRSVSNQSLWQGALVRGVRAGVAVYDALFVELAVREAAPLATFDRGILTAFWLSCNECGQVAARSSGRRGVPTAPATSELTGRGAPA